MNLNFSANMADFCRDSHIYYVRMCVHNSSKIITTASYFYTAAIKVVKVLVNILPFGDNVIPVVLELVDDKEIEPMDIYQLMIVNFSDPRAVAGDMDTSYIIVNDDDGKI